MMSAKNSKPILAVVVACFVGLVVGACLCCRRARRSTPIVRAYDGTGQELPSLTTAPTSSAGSVPIHRGAPNERLGGMEAAIEAGAEDVESGEEGHEVSTSVEDFATVRDALEATFGQAEAAKQEWWPSTTIDLDVERAREVLKLVDALDDHDDVQTVYANFEVDEAAAERGLVEWAYGHDVPLVAIAKGVDRDAGREWFHQPGKPPFQLPAFLLRMMILVLKAEYLLHC
jgi:hypothetical protein